jgi:hypothetical protein
MTSRKHDVSGISTTFKKTLLMTRSSAIVLYSLVFSPTEKLKQDIAHEFPFKIGNENSHGR